MQNREDRIGVEWHRRLQAHFECLADDLLITRLHKGSFKQEVNLLRRVSKPKFNPESLHHARCDSIAIWKEDLVLLKMPR